MECAHPPQLKTRVIVIDNNSADDTAQTVADLAAAGQLPVSYVFEPRQGQPLAINAGIAAANADLIAFFDDDERVFPDWLTVIAEEFRNPRIDFITGRCFGDWQAARPKWLPAQRLGLVGEIDPGDEVVEIRDLSAGRSILGGNTVVRRAAVRAAGGYSESLTFGNDAEFGVRLVHAGAVGRYVPALKVHHDVPANRLTKAYVRRRAMMNHAAAVRIRQLWPALEPLVFGFPYRIAYYRVRALLSGFPARLFGKADDAERFQHSLLLWDLIGLLRGWIRWDDWGRPRVMR